MEQIPETEAEIQYLEHVMQGIDNSSEVVELEEIKDELIKEGYLKGNDKNKKKKEWQKFSHRRESNPRGRTSSFYSNLARPSEPKC